MKHYQKDLAKQEDWTTNSSGIFVTGSYDDFSEVARRITHNEWEFVRYYYETETYEKQGSNCLTAYIREMMNEAGYDADDIELVLSFKPRKATFNNHLRGIIEYILLQPIEDRKKLERDVVDAINELHYNNNY